MKITSVILLSLTFLSTNSYSMGGSRPKVECDLEVSQSKNVDQTNAAKNFDFVVSFSDNLNVVLDNARDPGLYNNEVKAKIAQMSSPGNEKRDRSYDQLNQNCQSYFKTNYPNAKYLCGDLTFKYKETSTGGCKSGSGCYVTVYADLTMKGYLAREKTIEEMRQEKCNKLNVCIIQNGEKVDGVEFERMDRLKNVICKGEINLKTKSEAVDVNDSSRGGKANNNSESDSSINPIFKTISK